MCVITFDWENTDAKIKFEHFNLNPSVSWAVIELTNYCNFKCKWCYANSGINGLHMNRNDVEKLIRNLATYGIKQITFSGGEPLFYAHINEAIKYAKSFDLVIHMNTNGYLFTKELAFELKDAGLSQIQTNVDSLDPKKHDYIRGKEGSFQRAIEALKNARDSGLICVMQTVLTRLNETEIFDIFKFARDMGISRSRVWDVTPFNGCEESNMNVLDLRPTLNYIELIERLVDYAGRNGVQNIESDDPLFPLNYSGNISITGGFCVFAAGLGINVSPEGDVFFCSTNRKPIYNIFEVPDNEDIMKFHKFQLKSVLESFKISQVCKQCNLFHKCIGGCPTRRKHSINNLDYWCRN